MAAPRPPKGRKPFADNSSPVQGNRGSRGSAWNRGGGPNFPNAPRQNTQFPPLAGSQGRPETGYDPKLLTTLNNVIGKPVIISLKSGARHEGVVATIIAEGDAAGVTLKDCRDLSNPASAIRESFVLPASNIAAWNHPRMTNGADSFRTDTDISNTNASGNPKERELQQWQPEPAGATAASLAALQGDEATFGVPGVYSAIPWDQFEVNERLFGVNPKFDEEAYTTKLDRSAPGYKEKERKAEQIANEIISGTTSNPHVAEERVMNGTENGIGEEEKFSAVVRTPGAYVPPGARRNGSGPVPTQSTIVSEVAPVAPATNGTAAPTAPIPTISGPAPDDTAGKPQTEGLVANFRDFVTNEKHRLAQRKQAMVKTEMDKRKADLLKFSKSFKLSRPMPEDLVPILAKDEEKQKAIREKAIADALASQHRTAGPSTGTSAAPSATSTSKPPNSHEGTQKSAAKPAAQTGAQAKKPKGGMVIQAIPPFDKNKVRKAAAPSTTAAPAAPNTAQPTPGPSAPAIQAIPASPTAAQANSRLNANASVFKPNANAAVFKPGQITPGPTPSPKQREPPKEVVQPAPVSGPPNPFYGPRTPTKKGASVHLKDEFNPFRHAKVGDASQVSSIWPYNGKRFAALHPPTTAVHTAPGPNMPNPLIPGPPPQSHDEDPNMQQGPGQRQMPPQQQQQQAQQQQQQAQQQQQQVQQQQQQPQPPPYPIMYFPPYPPYSPAPPGQPPMMMPPNSPYMAGPYMHPVAYPHHMPPNGSMYGPPPGMPGVPPTPHYMPHSPFGQTSPPSTGTPRGPGPMQPQQMPPHAYYHPSPQMTHAMPYQMMMPPPGQHFDPAAQGPPVVPPQPNPMSH